MNRKSFKLGSLVLYILLTLILLLFFSGWFIINSYYPLKYTDEVNAACREYGLDVTFVNSVIAVESKFNAKSESSKGASGLMQLMPETADWIGSKINIENASDRLFDPDVNIRLGCWYLKFLKNRYDNSDTCAAAYNAGHGTVDGWLKDVKYSTDGKTLKQIPYKETADYVKKIRLAEKIYKYIYNIH